VPSRPSNGWGGPLGVDLKRLGILVVFIVSETSIGGNFRRFLLGGITSRGRGAVAESWLSPVESKSAKGYMAW